PALTALRTSPRSDLATLGATLEQLLRGELDDLPALVPRSIPALAAIAADQVPLAPEQASQGSGPPPTGLPHWMSQSTVGAPAAASPPPTAAPLPPPPPPVA